MAFELDEREDASTNLKRLVRERIDKAIDALSSGHGANESIHGARKRMKEIRAGLRLARAAVADRLFETENGFYRDIARPLSEVRDARALVDSLDSLLEHFAGEVRRPAFAPVFTALRSRLRRSRRRIIVEEGTLGRVCSGLRRARARVGRWRLYPAGSKAFAGGIARTYRSGRRRMAAALRSGSDESLHEWRKQAKYLRHEAEILRPVWPEEMEVVAKEAHELADLLGDDHDLAVMRGLVDRMRGPGIDGRKRKTLDGLIRERRATLQKRARRLGRKIYAEKPKAFARRIDEYVRAWS